MGEKCEQMTAADALGVLEEHQLAAVIAMKDFHITLNGPSAGASMAVKRFV
jgi:hypothetical protein